jgi:hypothetical protein
MEAQNDPFGGSKHLGVFLQIIKNTIFLLGFSRKMCKFAAEIKTLTTKRQTEVCVE